MGLFYTEGEKMSTVPLSYALKSLSARSIFYTSLSFTDNPRALLRKGCSHGGVSFHIMVWILHPKPTTFHATSTSHWKFSCIAFLPICAPSALENSTPPRVPLSKLQEMIRGQANRTMYRSESPAHVMKGRCSFFYPTNHAN